MIVIALDARRSTRAALVFVSKKNFLEVNLGFVRPSTKERIFVFGKLLSLFSYKLNPHPVAQSTVL